MLLFLNNMKKNIKIPSFQEIILWFLMAILLFKIKIFNTDVSKYIFLIMIVYLVFKYNDFKKIISKIGYKHYLIFFAIGLIWTFGLVYRELFYTFNDNSFYISSKELIVIFLYVLVFPLFCIIRFKDIEKFGRLITSIAIVQSSVIILSLFFQPMKDILSLYYNQNEEYLYYISANVKGVGFGVVGAQGAIALFSVQVLLVYMMIKKKINVRSFLIQYIVLMIAEAVSGRTAFYCSILLIIYWLFTERKSNIIDEVKKLIPKFIICLIGLFFVVFLINSELTIKIINRSLELFYAFLDNGESSITFNALREMSRPGLTLETLFGTSVTKGISSLGTYFQNDSGYWQKFFALGLIGAIAYYLGFLQLYLQPLFHNKLKKKSFYILLLLIMYLIEMKEPFFGYLVLPMMVITIMCWDSVDSSC